MIIYNQEFDTAHLTPGKISGKVKISGAKNSALRLVAASLINDGVTHLMNYPETLQDAQLHIKMNIKLGQKCVINNGEAVLDSSPGINPHLTWDERSIRNTLLILGALFTRHNSVSVPFPGGCKLGVRKHDLHLELIESFGGIVHEENDRIIVKRDVLRPCEFTLPIRSTGVTENFLIIASKVKGKSVLYGPHIRPEVFDLIELLRKYGVVIDVFGQERIEVIGHQNINVNISHTVIPDNMEALTWLIAAGITKGTLEIEDFPVKDLIVPLEYLRSSGLNYFIGDNSVVVRPGNCYPLEISTGPYPGINSDMQPLMAVWSLMSNGLGKIIDLRFPGRYQYMDELTKMGARFSVDGDLLLLYGDGDSRFQGNIVKAVDLRGGMACLLMSLVSKGETKITNFSQVLRGYDKLEEKLNILLS